MQLQKKRGFTLIELLVVVLIIGILVAVALPQYNKAVKKAQGREVLTTLNALDRALSSYYLENSTYAGANPDNLSVDIPALKHFHFLVGCPNAGLHTSLSPNLNTEHLSIGVGSDGGSSSISIGLVSPQDDLLIELRRYNQCSRITCSSNDLNSSSSCADYFNCDASPREYHPFQSQVGSPARDIPAHYTGGTCTLSNSGYSTPYGSPRCN